jgi:hypothetical protein
MNRSNMFKLGAAVVALAISSASVAKVLVVRAAGPSAKMYPRGKALPDSAKIQLQAGDSVMLLKPDGTRMLRGPGTFALAAAGGGGAGKAINRRARFSSLRSGATRLNPSPWNLDVTQSGKLCVVNASNLKLWRPEADAAIQLTVKGTGGEQTIEFEAGKDTVAWPTALPISSGAEYQLSEPESGDTARVTFVTVSSPPDDPVETAQTLIANDCENQLEVLVESSPSVD